MSEQLVEIWRGDMIESIHAGHAVVARASGEVVAAWGAPDTVIYPRSSCKMIQALPLIESGAAAAAGLGDEHLALACASHQGADIHTRRVGDWLSALGLSEADLLCGPQMPNDRPARDELRQTQAEPDQRHNNCSGKHCGFLTLGKHLGGGADYIDTQHPVQVAVRAAFEEMTGETSPRFATDGCSAPNFACTVAGLATAAARMADPVGGARGDAARRLVAAMAAHPLLVAGNGRACSELMEAMDGTVVKTGAEGVFVAIVPSRGLGVALKISDGATRASEAAMAALLVGLGVLDPKHPATLRRAPAEIRNRRNILTGHVRPIAALSQPI